MSNILFFPCASSSFPSICLLVKICCIVNFCSGRPRIADTWQKFSAEYCKIFSQRQRSKLTSRRPGQCLCSSLILTIFLASFFAYRTGHCKSNSCSYVTPASTSARCPPIRPPRFSCTWVSSVSRGQNCLSYGFDFRFSVYCFGFHFYLWFALGTGDFL